MFDAGVDPEIRAEPLALVIEIAGKMNKTANRILIMLG